MNFDLFLIDLDDTVYDVSTDIWGDIRRRIDQYMVERLGIPWEQVPDLRHQLFTQYGTTMRGLQQTMALNEMDFLAYVHDVPLDTRLKPDPSLRAMLKRYPQRKFIFTNADIHHARRVLSILEIQDCFDAVIDIHAVSPYCKPMPEAYQKALQIAGVENPSRVVMLDDSIRNLLPARELGIFTIQVSHQPALFDTDASISKLIHLPDIIPLPEGVQ